MLLCFILSQAKRKVMSYYFKIDSFFTAAPCCVIVHVYYWLHHIRHFQSVICPHNATVWTCNSSFLYSAHPTTTDEMTVFSGARPNHCGFKAPQCLKVAKSPKRPPENLLWAFFPNDITYYDDSHGSSCSVSPDWWESGVLWSGNGNRSKQFHYGCIFIYNPVLHDCVMLGSSGSVVKITGAWLPFKKLCIAMLPSIGRK